MTWLLNSLIKLTLNLKMVRSCICETVLFYFSYLCSFFISFPHPVISCSSERLCLSLSWGHAWISVPKTVKAVFTRAFCNRNNDAVETCVICTKHCKCIVMDPLWLIFRLQCVFSSWDEKASLIHFIMGSRRWAQHPLKKCFDFFPAVFLCSGLL